MMQKDFPHILDRLILIQKNTSIFHVMCFRVLMMNDMVKSYLIEMVHCALNFVYQSKQVGIFCCRPLFYFEGVIG
jgi:hypothetical protein